jgi:hypothetical protein
MPAENDDRQQIGLPEDLADAVDDLSRKYGESVKFIVIAAVEHFTRIPEEQRRAVLVGTARRRRG